MEKIKIVFAEKIHLSSVEITGKTLDLSEYNIAPRLKVLAYYEDEPLVINYAFNDADEKWMFFSLLFLSHDQSDKLGTFFKDMTRRNVLGEKRELEIEDAIKESKEYIINHELVRLKSIL